MMPKDLPDVFADGLAQLRGAPGPEITDDMAQILEAFFYTGAIVALGESEDRFGRMRIQSQIYDHVDRIKARQRARKAGKS